jgi:tyrosinase
MAVRKNQSRLTRDEWRSFIEAIDATHGMGIPAPRYRDFVRVHIDAMTTAEGMRWGVHTMFDMGMVGRNFLAWHRQYLVQLERRLQVVRPNVAIPFWNWTRDRSVPAALSGRSLLQRWGVTRGRIFDASVLRQTETSTS